MTAPTHVALREQFLRYFEAHGHRRIASAGLVPQSDPTLLFTNAGMVPFKPWFVGEQSPAAPRAVSCQKCVRAGGKHNDLENVGYTARHHTFFEMLGNFSFGDYFKPEAIELAWQFVTRELGLDPERLVVTVFRGEDDLPADEEAASLWAAQGVPPERILRLGMADNFWSMGETGPCGPCSEIHYYQGELEPEAALAIFDTPAAEDQWIEIWNLVFMQFERFADGRMVELPAPSIDTGMGLERLCAVVQGVRSNYDTDLFTPILARIRALFGLGETLDGPAQTASRVIADHARATAFLIADGVLPSNEGRGYVLRRIMRRAIRYGNQLREQAGPGAELAAGAWFFSQVCDAVVAEFGGIYPELREQQAVLTRVVDLEEERFGATLEFGLKLLADMIAKVRTGGGSELPGADVFQLYDTYGFPPDLTAVIAREHEMGIDEAGFEAAMAAQRKRARGERAAAGDGADSGVQLDGLEPTVFTGYQALTGAGRVLALIRNGESVAEVEAPADVEVVLDQTPFYAESGGQVADTGTWAGPAARGQVLDVQKQGGIFVHRLRVEGGTLGRDDALTLSVDGKRRRRILAHHTGTHLLQAALREVLGTHVRQAGSRVDPERLRFDFSHFAAMDPAERLAVENRVNAVIRENLPIRTREMAYDDAIAAGALAFFGDRYGSTVRVVEVPGFSVELCGGTHVGATGEIGLWLFESEGGVAAGTRRVEAVAGERALERVRGLEQDLETAAGKLGVSRRAIVDRLDTLLATHEAQSRELETLRARQAGDSARDLAAAITEIGGVPVLARIVDAADIPSLRQLADRLREQHPELVILLAARGTEGPALFAAVPESRTPGLHAGKLLQTAAAVLGGRGGGRPTSAQGGGGDPAQLDAALTAFAEAVAASGAES